MDTDLLDTAPGTLAPQQPDWEEDPRLSEVRKQLLRRPPLVRPGQTDRLHALLARAAAGEALVVMAGDCAEDPAECGPEDVAAKSGLVQALAGRLQTATRRPVIGAARIAGQFAKPRSRPTELVDGRELPVYRGHMVNAPDPGGRTPDPGRLLSGYEAARSVMRHLGWLEGEGPPAGSPSVWTCHEALLLDYEVPMLRPGPDGRTLLASTHWPWLGDRTRDPDGPHAALLSSVANPVACKVGPTIEVPELLALCRRLDPDHRPGRLTLIARLGPRHTAGRLPELVAAVRRAGHPAIWLTDPMHGNTVVTPSGHKTRYVERMVREVGEFLTAVREGGGIAGGLHLEATPVPVTECVPDASRAAEVTGRYTTLCDPRLNPEQAATVVSAWAD